MMRLWESQHEWIGHCYGNKKIHLINKVIFSSLKQYQYINFVLSYRFELCCNNYCSWSRQRTNAITTEIDRTCILRYTYNCSSINSIIHVYLYASSSLFCYTGPSKVDIKASNGDCRIPRLRHAIDVSVLTVGWFLFSPIDNFFRFKSYLQCDNNYCVTVIPSFI